MLSSPVLVLNRSYLPVQITSARRALVLLYRGHARVVGDSYQDYNFDQWLALAVEAGRDSIGLVGRWILLPRVLRLDQYDKIPKRKIRFSRHNVFLRDHHTCQYCSDSLPKNDLNIDHVIPRSRGGKTTWDNVVACCLECNHRKGNWLPEEVGMRLIKSPGQPHWVPYFDKLGRPVHYQEWQPYLPMAAAG